MARKTTTVDPIKLIRDDHKKVQKLFKEFEKTEDSRASRTYSSK